MNQRSAAQRGFTLMEVMITVAIIGLLAVIAMPTYREHAAKARRAEAVTALMEGAQALERHYSLNGSYLRDGALAPVFKPRAGSYALAAEGEPTANTFRLRATRQGGMADDGCGDYRIDHTGALSVVDHRRDEAACLRR